MNDVDKKFQDFEFSTKADKPISEFSNWIFGISAGMCALLIFQMKDFDIEKYTFLKMIYILLVIWSMINLMLTGYSKYLVFKRDIDMGVKYGTFKKSVVLLESYKETPNYDIEKINVMRIFNEYLVEYNKIRKVGKYLNISILTSVITVLLTGVFILLLLTN